jgi:glycosyltransferase involved in cell wall biosynthesis
VGGKKKEEIEALKARAANLGVARRVIFHGFVEPAKVREKITKADVLVLPARGARQMPYAAHMKLFEYMTAARPIVATNLPSISEFVRNGKEALLVEPDSAVSLAQGIKEVMEDGALAQRLAEGAYRAVAQFTWPSRARTLADFFRAILEKRREELNVRSEK